MLFDLNGDGCIDYNDLRGTLVSLGDKIDDQAIRNMLAEVRVFVIISLKKIYYIGLERIL